VSLAVALVVPVLGTGWPSGQVLDLALGLARAHVRVLVLAEDGRLAHEFQRHGIPVELGPLPRRTFLDRRRLRAVRDTLRRHRRDSTLVLHGHGAEAAAPAAFLARRMRAELVLTLYDRADVRAAPPLRGVRLDAVFATSEASEEELVNHRGVPRDLVHVAGPGIDPVRVGLELGVGAPRCEPSQSDEELSPAPADPKPPEKGLAPRGPSEPLSPGRVPVLGALGRLEPLGGHETLLQAARELAARGLDFQVLVVGEGPEKRRLLPLARELGLSERTIFAGDLPGRSEFFETIDVFVAPAMREGFGHDLLEAMAWGRPVVAAGSGAIFEHVEDGVTGLLAPPSDGPALAVALARMLTDKEEARAMGRRARESVAHRFPVERLVDETVRVYERVSTR
jgi:glycosyltransferase involved in cell wall biosynthesis